MDSKRLALAFGASAAILILWTLLFPPPEPRGYSLIVDGTARTTDDGFVLEPATAVLHRPADHADPGTPHTHDAGCGHDCRPV